MYLFAGHTTRVFDRHPDHVPNQGHEDVDEVSARFDLHRSVLRSPGTATIRSSPVLPAPGAGVVGLKAVAVAPVLGHSGDPGLGVVAAQMRDVSVEIGLAANGFDVP